MPKAGNSKGSDDDFEFKGRGEREDFNFDLEIKGTSHPTQARRTAKSISTNAETRRAESSTTPTLPFTTTARSPTAASSLKIQSTMARSSKAPPRTEEGPA
jgi:hypothetical protein